MVQAIQGPTYGTQSELSAGAADDRFNPYGPISSGHEVAVGAEGVTAFVDQIGTIAGNSLIQRETPTLCADACSPRFSRPTDRELHRVHRGRLHP